MLTEQKTRPEGREGRVFRRLNALMQRLLHPGRERGRLPVRTPTTATMAVKKATPMQECVCLCLCVRVRALKSGCVIGRFRPKFSACHFPAVWLDVAVGAPPPKEKPAVWLHRRIFPVKEACGSITSEDKDYSLASLSDVILPTYSF